MPNALTRACSLALDKVLVTPDPEVVAKLRSFKQTEMPVAHRFQDGVYIRDIFMPADTWVLGAVHKFHHWNIIFKGRVLVSMNGGELKEVQTGDVFESRKGVQKWLYVADDTHWLTIHKNPTNSRDIAWLEDQTFDLDPVLFAGRGVQTMDEFRMAVNQRLQS